MGKYTHKNGEVGSGFALNMIKANSSQPFSLTSSPVNKGRGKQDRKVRKAVKTNIQVENMKKAGNIESSKYERKVKKLDKTIEQIDKSKNRRDKSENTLKDLSFPKLPPQNYIEYRQLPRLEPPAPSVKRFNSVAPLNQGDGSRLKKKINKLSAKHEALHNAVIEGYGQNEFTSGNYDKDYKKLVKVEDRLKRKEEKYQSKFNKSPYSMEGPLNKGCAKSEGGPGCVQKRGNEYVIINNKKPGNQVWRGGFASKAEANKVLAGYHASK